MRELEQSLRDLLAHDAQEYDPRSSGRILETLAMTQRSSRSRSRVWAGVVAVSAMTAVVVAGVAVVGRTGNDERPTQPTDGETRIADLHPTRQAGLNSVVVTVPIAWPTTDAVCDEPAVSYVYYDSDIRNAARCPFRERGAMPETIVGIGDSDSDVGRGVSRHLKRSGQPVDGFEVLESALSCEEPRVVSCFQSFVVPELGTYFTVRSRGEGAMDEVAAIRESLRILTAGITTVPFTPNGTLGQRIADIEAAGLSVKLVEQPAAATGTFLGADPALGTAVPEGSTVTLTVSG
jgi:hypothetical protein